MTLSQEQVNIAFSVIIALIVALTGYLQNQSSKKRHAETQAQLAKMQTKVNDLHAETASMRNAKSATVLEDGHELPPFEKPPARPLP